MISSVESVLEIGSVCSKSVGETVGVSVDVGISIVGVKIVGARIVGARIVGPAVGEGVGDSTNIGDSPNTSQIRARS